MRNAPSVRTMLLKSTQKEQQQNKMRRVPLTLMTSLRQETNKSCLSSTVRGVIFTSSRPCYPVRLAKSLPCSAEGRYAMIYELLHVVGGGRGELTSQLDAIYEHTWKRLAASFRSQLQRPSNAKRCQNPAYVLGAMFLLMLLFSRPAIICVYVCERTA